MSNPLYNARVLATGEEVWVYRHQKGFFVDWSDMETEYKKHELKIISELK